MNICDVYLLRFLFCLTIWLVVFVGDLDNLGGVSVLWIKLVAWLLDGCSISGDTAFVWMDISLRDAWKIIYENRIASNLFI